MQQTCSSQSTLAHRLRMRLCLRHCLVGYWGFGLVCLLVTGAAGAAGQPQVLVEVDRTRLYEGESLRYRVTLNHVENPTAPKLDGFDDFDVKSLGETPLHSRQITIINGRTSEIVRYGRAYDYRLTPRKSGPQTIPAPSAVVEGVELKGQTVAIEVVPPGDQDIALLEVDVDRAFVYPMQPFTVTLKILVKELPEPYEDRSPVAVQSQPPKLSIPWVQDDSLPDGLEAKVPWQQWLGAIQSRRRGGFSINSLSSNSIFSLFDDTLAFLPKARRVSRLDATGKAINYQEFTLARTFVPQKVGEYSFGPVTVKGTFAGRLDASHGLLGEEIYAVAKPVQVVVKDVPLLGRPDSYIGAVGQFQVSADLSPTQAQVGDPMTLTITLRGEGTLENAIEPDLNRIAEITERFKVYEATSRTEGNTKQFTYSLRPKQSGTEPFPEIPVAYFDVDQEKYVELATKAIPIEVTQAERLSQQDIAMASSGRPAGRSIETQQGGIFANISDLAALKNESISPDRWFLGYLGAAGCFVVVVLVTRQVQRLTSDQALLRRRAAPGKARRRLRDALAAIDSNRYQDAAEHLRDSLVGLVADVADEPAAGLTSGDVQTRLRDMGIDEDVIDRLCQLLDACDSTRYGASGDALLGLRQDADNLLNTLMQTLKRKKMLG